MGYCRTFFSMPAYIPKEKNPVCLNWEKGDLFHSLKITLRKMTDLGEETPRKIFLGKMEDTKPFFQKTPWIIPVQNAAEK
jgi:hypothetical protein